METQMLNVDFHRAVTLKAERVRLTEASVIGLRSAADGLRLFDSQPHRVPITKEFLALGRSAYSHYVHRLEQEKAEAAKKKAELEALQNKQSGQRFRENLWIKHVSKEVWGQL